MGHDDIRAALLQLERDAPDLRVARVSYPGATAESMPLGLSHPLVVDGPAGYTTIDGLEIPL